MVNATQPPLPLQPDSRSSKISESKNPVNASTNPVNHIYRFESPIVLAWLLAGAWVVGLGGEARGQDLAGDRQALVALYNATDGENWTDNQNWLSEEPLGHWKGVYVSDGRVTRLFLRDNELTGTIPPELGQLSSLDVLDLSTNELTGTIPPELGQLSSLRLLWLHNNALMGPTPPELGQLSNLTQLWLFDNALTGLIPPELGQLSSLTGLLLDDNELTGAIPPELVQLSSLTVLWLGGNELTGAIPPELGQLSSLERLLLDDNELTGAIPPELGQLSSLTVLWLDENELTGAIPPELGQLSSLERLLLRNNELTGAIPPELGQLSSLTVLLLRNNELTGLIPQSFTNLTLEVFSFNGNPGLCAQSDAAIQDWLGGIGRVQGRNCSPSEMYSADREVLVALYNATDGENWANNRNWLSEEPLDDWYGVDVNIGRVTWLALPGNQLTGPIPPELGQLSRLGFLGLNDNGLTGTIPPELGRLSSLTNLLLNDNELMGTIPQSFTNLGLGVFSFSGNRDLCAQPDDAIQTWLSGIGRVQGPNCPPSERYLADREALVALYNATEGKNWANNKNWLSEEPLDGWYGVTLSNGRVTRLVLPGNQLTGPIPRELGQLSRLAGLGLNDNGLTGPIPPELGQLPSLEWLILSGNALTGPIPHELGDLAGLLGLYLNDNALTGPIPPELGQLSSLQRLYLSGNALTGPIPRELGQLSHLQVFFLDNNALTGQIPRELGQLSSLEVLDLSINSLAGPIPRELGQLYSLTNLLLNDNALTGPIPTELGQLSSLRWLYLSDNQLEGEIPPRLGQLCSLKRLYLSDNQLTGNIPPELGQLSELERLHLQHNRLMGTIPAELGRLSNLAAFSFRGNRLTGVAPARLSRLPDVYLLNLTATWAGPGRIKATWDDPGDPVASYRYRLRNETETWTEWASIEHPATMLKRGEGITIEWTLRGLPPDADYNRIGIRVSNATGHSIEEAPVTVPVTPVAPEPEVEESLFVPVILTSAGRNNSFFTSALTLTNRGTEEATLHYTYTADRGGGSGTATDRLAPGRQRIQSDALGYLTGLGIPIPVSGNRTGTLRVGVSGSSGVSVVTRTTTAVPEGRAGLAYPGIGEDEGFQQAVYLCGLRENSQDRSNVAVQNMGAEGSIILRTTVYSGSPTDPKGEMLADKELGPGEFHQFNAVMAGKGDPMQGGYVKVEKVAGRAPFYAYGVINDNFNSDGSFVFPVAEDSLVGRSGQTLPVIIETGSFQSELTVTNFSSSEKELTVSFVADAVDTTDDTATFSLRLEAGEQHILSDLVSWLRRQKVAGIGAAGPAFVGALFATPVVGDMSGIVMGARTGAPDGRGGQYSLFYNGVPYGSASVDSAWVYGLQQNEENRGNLALVNTGEIDDSSSTFEITIYDGSGNTEARTRSVTVGARRWTQIDGILGDISQGYVQVRKTSGNNPFITYGVVNDGGRPEERSGDGAFLPAQP